MISTRTRNTIHELYTQGKNYTEIAKTVGVTPITAARWAKKPTTTKKTPKKKSTTYPVNYTPRATTEDLTTRMKTLLDWPKVDDSTKLSIIRAWL
jgi:transposase